MNMSKLEKKIQNLEIMIQSLDQKLEKQKLQRELLVLNLQDCQKRKESLNSKDQLEDE
jgi:predicted ribosome quality control (RQC) complex YloA/Tae2 family protein